MMVIQCDTLEKLVDVCYALMVKGATFKANTENLTVTLSGGF
jgi:hypothetical protein